MTNPDDCEGESDAGFEPSSGPGTGPPRPPVPVSASSPGARSRSDRLPDDPVWRKVVLAAHDAAVEAGEDGYIDPVTGLFVMTAGYLTARGTCCGSNCRHCPYGTRP